jgi:hypothetical protein
MKPFWSLILPAENGRENVYQCFGCANCCTYEGLFKPLSCTGTPITETFD